MSPQISVLVTGAKGFIGRNLVPYLRRRGLHVKIYDGDVVALATYSKHADVIVHLASRVYSSLEKTSQDGYEPYRTNVLGTVSVCEYARKHKGAIIFSSSSAVYQDPQGLSLVSENQPTHTKSLNALTKRLAEDILDSFAKNHRIPVTVLRLFNVYGPFQKEPYLIPYLIRCIREKKTLEVRNPQGIRDYVYVDDISEAIFLAIIKARSPNDLEVFNIGSGTQTTVLQLIKELGDLMKCSPQIISPASASDEVSAMVADTSRAVTALGWKSKTTLRDGLEKTLATD